ncbi:hypothetical protein A5680_21725 [Mycobacterium sp. E2989]|nr:hypothetical protein A5680_21725 [Mycobacterium sp. E2989]
MPAQNTAEPAITATIENAAPESPVDRRLLIGGRLVATDRTFPSSNPATGAVIGYAPDGEFLERKTFAVPAAVARA